MALGIYKPEQGYWVRVMTACLIGLVTLATAGFVWQQGALLADTALPKNTAQIALRLESGTPAPGQKVTLLGSGSTAGQVTPIGTAVVKAYLADRQSVRLDEIVMEGSHAATETMQIVGDGGGAGALKGVVAAGQVTMVAPIEPLYVQGGLAAVVLVIGAALGYWLVAVRAQTVDFLILTDIEMKKVNWSTPREVIGSTWVVVGACFLIAGSLFVFDLGFKTFFQAIGVLVK
jgi:preprotein translocase SecE subunit